jgi:S-adenosylmethionine decarboxylase
MKPSVAASGLHLIGDLYGCKADQLLLNKELLRARCISLVKSSKLTIAGDYFHQFNDAGVTGVVVLAESHLSIHTWPETGYVTVDVYVCNYSTDNSHKARKLFNSLVEALNPEEQRTHTVTRG